MTFEKSDYLHSLDYFRNCTTDGKDYKQRPEELSVSPDMSTTSWQLRQELERSDLVHTIIATMQYGTL